MDSQLLINPLMRLRQWCQDAAHALEDLRHWGTIAQLTDNTQSARLAHLQRRLMTDRVNMAIVGAAGRSTNRLVNQLLFSDFGIPALPDNNGSVVHCPLELSFDPSKPPLIRFLPIETRADPRSLREYLAGDDGWALQSLDLSAKAKIAGSLSEIAQSRQIPLADAVKYSLPPRHYGQTVGEDGSAMLTVPRWRFAQANLPHPALRCGLVVLYIPDPLVLQLEPELPDHRMRDIDATMMVADIAKGIEASDAELFRMLFVEEASLDHAFIVLNGVEQLPANNRGAEAERRGLLASSSLSVARARVYTVANEKTSDGSEVNRLVGSVTDFIFNSRTTAHSAALQAESGAMLSEGRLVLESRRSMMDDHLSKLQGIFEKNQKLMTTLSSRVTDEGTRVRSAQALFDDCSASHQENMEGIRTRLDPKNAKLRSAAVANRISSGAAGSDLEEVIAEYFQDSAELLQQAVDRIQAVQTMVQQLNRAFSLDYGLKPVDVPHFATVRFAGELSKLEAKAAEEFRGIKRSFTRSWDDIAEHFTDNVGSKVDHVFAIASRESNLWLNSLMRGFEGELAQMQHEFSQRLNSMTRLKDANTSLDTEINQLTGERDSMVSNREVLAEKARQVARLLERIG